MWTVIWTENSAATYSTLTGGTAQRLNGSSPNSLSSKVTPMELEQPNNPNEFDERAWERWFWLEHEPSCPNRKTHHAHVSPPAWLVAELVNGPPVELDLKRRLQEIEERTTYALALLDKLQRRHAVRANLIGALEQFLDCRTQANAHAVIAFASELQRLN
jgi:hypothetical protein